MVIKYYLEVFSLQLLSLIFKIIVLGLFFSYVAFVAGSCVAKASECNSSNNLSLEIQVKEMKEYVKKTIERKPAIKKQDPEIVVIKEKS